MNKKIIKMLEEEQPSTSIDVSVSVSNSSSTANDDTTEVVEEITETTEDIEAISEASESISNYRNSILNHKLPAGTMSIIKGSNILSVLGIDNLLPATESLDEIGENQIEADEVADILDNAQTEVIEPAVMRQWNKFILLSKKLQLSIKQSASLRARVIREFNEELEVLDQVEVESTIPVVQDTPIVPEQVELVNEVVNVPVVTEVADITPEVVENVDEVASNLVTDEASTVVEERVITKEDIGEVFTKTADTIERNTNVLLKQLKAVESLDKKIANLSTREEKINAYRNVSSFVLSRVKASEKVNRLMSKRASTLAGKVINIDEVTFKHKEGTNSSVSKASENFKRRFV